MGGTGVAGLPAAEGAFLNPAAVTIFPGAGAEGLFRDGAPRDGQHRHAWSVGAADNTKDALFSGAFHYARTRDLGRVSGAVSGELYHGAFGYRFTELLALGASAYRRMDRVPEGAMKRYTQWNYDLGLLLMFTPSVGFGYTLRNLANPGGEVPRPLRANPEQAAGVYAGLGEFVRLRLDVARRERDNVDQKLAYMAGVEARMRSLFLFRVGFRHDKAGDGRVITSGLSLDGPRLKVDYAVEKAIEGASGALHSVDMRIPF